MATGNLSIAIRGASRRMFETARSAERTEKEGRTNRCL
jgi:hypothetical protein